MNWTRFALVAVLIGTAVLAGCGDKKVRVTFVNTSTRDLEVEWAEQGIAPMYLATVPAGGQFRHVVKEDKDMLPTYFEWTAGGGSYAGKVPITRSSPDRVWVDIVEQRLRDADTEIKETRKVDTEPIQIHQETVLD